MDVTIGRVVIYKTTESDQELMRITPNCNVAEELPAIIVVVHSKDKDPLVNLNVKLDGEGSLWATSVQAGDEPGEWRFPEIKLESAALKTQKDLEPEFKKDLVIEIKKDLVAEVKKDLITSEVKNELIAETTKEVMAEIKKEAPKGDEKKK